MTSVQKQRKQIQRAREARDAAAELGAVLAELQSSEADVKFTVASLGGDRSVTLPRTAVVRLTEILEALGDGQDPSVVPATLELSTGDVADLLGVSRQYAVRLIDDGRIASRRVGNRRRVRMGDALRYLRDDNRKRVQRYRDRVLAES